MGERTTAADVSYEMPPHEAARRARRAYERALEQLRDCYRSRGPKWRILARGAVRFGWGMQVPLDHGHSVVAVQTITESPISPAQFSSGVASFEQSAIVRRTRLFWWDVAAVAKTDDDVWTPTIGASGEDAQETAEGDVREFRVHRIEVEIIDRAEIRRTVVEGPASLTLP